MKFSENWLRSLVDPGCTSSELAHLLTMAGLEVEEATSVAPPFSDVVVAEVLEVVKHPDADRLNVCQVNIGSGVAQQIVCGAPNVAVGMKVPCALPGARLPGDFNIKQAKVRGVASAGMLCSAKELGISQEASGLLALPATALVGQCVREALDLDDHLLTLKLTPNRADCLSLTGLAREVSALTGRPWSPLAVAQPPVSTDSQREVCLDAPEACPRYLGQIIQGVDAKAATPEWMRSRLERSGLRSISALVDITNYVMLELGQPLHAFDDQHLQGAIHVRWARDGESLRLLNEQQIELTPDLLVIADESGPLALAGVMGGAASGISLDTTALFLESAFFAPAAIAGRARRYNFTSDASHRFERGVDFAGAAQALARATQLVLDICGGAAGPVVEACAPAQLPLRPAVGLRVERAARVLGIALPMPAVSALLDRLGFATVADAEKQTFLVTPPSHRFDLTIEEDLIEELARLYGYDNIPAPAPLARHAMLPQSEASRTPMALRQTLVDLGFQEVINFAFVEADWEAQYTNNTAPVRLANPIASPLAVMRSSLFGGLIANLTTNLKRQSERVNLFEIGRCFMRDATAVAGNGYQQPWRLAALSYGSALPEQWGVPARPVDFFDLKGTLEALLSNANLRFERCQHPALHPGRSAQVMLDGTHVGVIGELHPQWVQQAQLPQAPVLFELDLAPLLPAAIPAFSELSRFPAVVRDLAITVDQTLALQTLLDGLNAHRPDLVLGVELFDLYTGKGVDPGKKSLAFRIVMQDTQRTLQDAEVDAAMQQIVCYLDQAFAAKLRV